MTRRPARRAHAALLPLLLLPWLALPSGRAHAAGAKEDAPPPEPKVKATAISMPHPDVPEEMMVTIMRALEAGMKKNERLDMRDLDTRLADFAAELPSDQIDAARAALKDGQKALLELNIPDATKKLDEAVNGLIKVLPFIKKQELADAMATLAIAQYEGGDKVAGKKQFVRLLTWRSDYVFDPSKLPPKYQVPFEEAQAEIAKLKQGTLKITSDPDGAQAYVDGKFYGVTPCAANDLTAGEHFVTLKKEGYKKAVVAADVQPKKERKVDVLLVRFEKYLLVEQSIKALDKTIGQDVGDPEMDTFKSVLFVEHAVFVRAKSKNPTTVDVEAYLYDLRTRHRLSKVALTMQKGGEEKELEALAGNLYVNVSYEGDLALPKEREPPKQAVRLPIYKAWYLWTAVVVLVAGGVVGGVVGWSLRPITCRTGDDQVCPSIKY